MKTEVKTLSMSNDGKVVKEKLQEEKEYTQRDIIEQILQIQSQQQGIISQMENMKNQYDILENRKAKFNEQLAGFKTELPTIS
jgi:hypothetical protein